MTRKSNANWEYFEIFDSVLGTTAASCPQDDILSSPLSKPKSIDIDEAPQCSNK